MVQVEGGHLGHFVVSVVRRMLDRFVGVRGVVFGVGVKVIVFRDVPGSVAEIGTRAEMEPRASLLFEVI